MIKVTEALEYLLETDDRLADLKATSKYYDEFKVKKVKGKQFLANTGTKDERESRAFQSDEVKTVYDEKREIDKEKETIATKRKSCELVIEVWRSKNANRRQGNI